MRDPKLGDAHQNYRVSSIMSSVSYVNVYAASIASLEATSASDVRKRSLRGL
jgi:hypothetical protein